MTTMAEMHGAPELDAGAPLLDPAGPAVVLGGADPFVGAVEPTDATLFGPRGAYLANDGSLWVADTGHHRLLGWRETPTEDGRPADIVIGQPDFVSEGRNALGDPSATTMNVPTGVHAWGENGIAVGDAWNNRVLVWFARPTESGVPADLVLGQADFTGQDPNRGTPVAGPGTMHWPFALRIIEGRLYVADAGNRRILIWNALPTEVGQPADAVIGQPDLKSRSDNGGGDANAASFRWPHAISVVDGRLAVSDAGNNRVLLWDGVPTSHEPATAVLGQTSFTGTEHNQGRYWPGAAAMNMPYAMDAADGRIVVGDTANSRLLGFRAPFADSADAVELTGQAHFGTKGDNRWGPPVRDSLCWPYGMQIVGDRLVLADTGNHRVVLWDFAAGDTARGATG